MGAFVGKRFYLIGPEVCRVLGIFYQIDIITIFDFLVICKSKKESFPVSAAKPVNFSTTFSKIWNQFYTVVYVCLCVCMCVCVCVCVCVYVFLHKRVYGD